MALLGGLGVGTRGWTASQPDRVPLATVAETALASGFTVTGRVGSAQRARVGARVQGRVVERRVDRGARVGRGEVLAVLAADAEEADIAEARAAVAEARARLAELRAGPLAEEILMAEARLRAAEVEAGLAERNSARLRDLFQQGFIAAQQAEEGEARAATAAHEAHRARQALELLRRGPRPEALEAAEMKLRARQARLRRMEAAHAELTIRSPLAGTVIERSIEPGETVVAGQGLFLVGATDPAHLEVRADVEEGLMGQVRLGQRVLFLPDGASRALEGRVGEIAPGVDGSKGTVEIKVRPLRAGDARALRPGTTGHLTVITAEQQGALVVPRGAVWSDGRGQWAVRVRGGRAERVPLRAGIEADGRVQVLDGLRAGDQVVAVRPQQIPPGRALRAASDGP